MAGIGPKRPDLQVESTAFPELIKRTLSLPKRARSLPFIDHFVDHAYAVCWLRAEQSWTLEPSSIEVIRISETASARANGQAARNAKA